MRSTPAAASFSAWCGLRSPRQAQMCRPSSSLIFLTVLCLLRLSHPKVEIRIAGGREINLRWLQAMGLYAANSMFVSDYLTTKGQDPQEDFKMVADLGFEIVTGDHISSDEVCSPVPDGVEGDLCGEHSRGGSMCGGPG